MNNQNLMSALSDCIAACNYCADECLQEEHVKEMVNCIRTDRVCAAVCTALYQIAATSYTNSADLLQVCIRVCEECEAECAKHAHMHEHCSRCAEACRICAKVCRQFAS